MRTGERVRVKDDYSPADLRGQTGVVMGFSSHYLAYAIKLDCGRTVKSGLLHDCEGLCPNFDGRWFSEDRIELVTQGENTAVESAEDSTAVESAEDRRERIWRAIQDACR